MTEPSEPTEPTEIAPPAVEVPARTRFAEPVALPAAQPVEPFEPEPLTSEPVPLEPQAAVETAPAPELPPVQAEEPADETAPAPELLPVPAEEPAEPSTPAGSTAAPEPAEIAPAYEAPVYGSRPEVRGADGLVIALAIVVALLAGLTGFLGFKAATTSGPEAGQAARQPALQAVRSAAVLLFSYDYRHLAADFKAGRATTTGAFQGEYDKTTDKLVKDVAPRYKAVVIAAVSEASVVSASADKVVTLVFLNQQSSSTLTAAPKVTQSRLLMTLVRKNGTWLVSDISPR